MVLVAKRRDRGGRRPALEQDMDQWGELIAETAGDRDVECAPACSSLVSELAASTGVNKAVAAKIILVLGIDRNVNEAAALLGRPPTLADIVVAYRIAATLRDREAP
jgi:hypothetical protein